MKKHLTEWGRLTGVLGELTPEQNADLETYHRHVRTMMMPTITAERFRMRTGSEPVHDDLERANCPLAGTFGHWGCGWCEHNIPVWQCADCSLRIVTRGR
jgi:hypothetical protein